MSDEIKPFKDVEEADAAHVDAQIRVDEMCDAAWNGKSPWTMSIPARETDHDLYFSWLLHKDLATIRAQEAEITRLQAELAERTKSYHEWMESGKNRDVSLIEALSEIAGEKHRGVGTSEAPQVLRAQQAEIAKGIRVGELLILACLAPSWDLLSPEQHEELNEIVARIQAPDKAEIAALSPWTEAAKAMREQLKSEGEESLVLWSKPDYWPERLRATLDGSRELYDERHWLMSEIARLRQENTDYAQDAKDTLPLYDKINQLTAALAKAPCQDSRYYYIQCTMDEDQEDMPDCGQCAPCKARAAQDEEDYKTRAKRDLPGLIQKGIDSIPNDFADLDHAAQPKDCPHGQHPHACGLCFDNCENCNQETGESCPKHGGGHEPNRPAQPESKRPCPRCGADCEWKSGDAQDVFRFYHRFEGFGSVSSRWNPCGGFKPRGIQAAQDKEKNDAQE